MYSTILYNSSEGTRGLQRNAIQASFHEMWCALHNGAAR